MDINREVSATIRAVMAVEGEYQRDAAVVMGVTPNRVSDRFSGRTKWTLEDLQALADHWDLHPWDLLRGPAHALTALGDRHNACYAGQPAIAAA